VLDAAIARQLTAHFAAISEPVELVASLDDSPRAAELWQLLTELAGLSDHVTARRVNDADADGRRPSFEIRSATTTGEGVRFAGVPMGHEFTSLVLAILHVGGHPSTAPAELVDRVAALEGEYRFETFFSQSCQNCPEVVQALNLMSVLNPGIHHVAIDGAAFREEAERRQVLAVPNVFLNGEPFAQGRLGLEEIVARLDSAGGARRAEALDARDPFDVLVVGGVPAGAAAAIYAARKGIATGLLAERFGGQLLDTVGIENFVSVPGTEGPRMATDLEAHVRDYPVDLIHLERARALTPAADVGGLATVELDSGARLRARTVVLATGARWRQLGVPGEAEYRNKGVTYCPHCDGPMFKGKRVAVVGGGNSGVEAAIDLAGVVDHVTLVEFDTALRADAVLQRKLLSLPNVDVVLNAMTTEVVGGATMTGLVYEDRSTLAPHHLAVEGVFVQIGLLPNTEWLEGTVELSPRGEIVIDERGRTSAPGVFAAGDCTTVPYKQIVVAMGAGSTAALGAFDHLIRSTAPAEPALDEVAVA
jgi:alkyl hydroperoxide reductase subunit F